MKRRKTITVFSIIILGFFMFFISSESQFAQLSTRLVLCNERESVRDTVYFPRGARTINGRKYAVFTDSISNTGKYAMTIYSNSDFYVRLLRRSQKSGSKWQTINRSARAGYRKVRSSYKYFFEYKTSFNTDSLYGFQYQSIILPATKNAVFARTWYTSDCEKDKPRTTQKTSKCFWSVSTGTLGITTTCTCMCGGKNAKSSRCGKKPRGCP